MIVSMSLVRRLRNVYEGLKMMVQLYKDLILFEGFVG